MQKPRATIVPNWNAAKCMAKATIKNVIGTIALPEHDKNELSK
ncbi:MAG: hypothetical protein ABSE82_03425 [Nitrososphaerales archaeon]